MSKPLYAIPLGPQPFIPDLCWGSCGKGQVGALTFEGLECIPCRQEICPHIERQSECVGDMDGDPVYLRVLTDPSQPHQQPESISTPPDTGEISSPEGGSDGVS